MLRSCPEARFAFRSGKPAVSAQQTARQNHLLAALTVGDYERLLPHLEPVRLPLGRTVHGAGERERCLYFLIAGIVSRVCVTASGASTEFAVTGSEGVIGVASFLRGESTPTRAVVLSAGHAYRFGADLLNSEFRQDSPLARLLLRYIQALITQIGQIGACNRHHSLEQRLCRWILSCLDRLPSNELMVTQEVIAHMLGVRREGITEAAGRLQQAGLIQHHRGHIAVLDRPELEAQACECYAAVKRAYDELLHPVRTVGNADVHHTRHQQRTGCEEPPRAELTRR